MRNAPPNDVHSVLVSTWEKKYANELSFVQHLELLEKGIRIVEQRASQTLSRVTLLVILDRVLHKSIDDFPVLSPITIGSDSLTFKIGPDLKNKNPEQLIEALRFLLIELLRVIGRITADILTLPLHEELLKVTWNEPEKK